MKRMGFKVLILSTCLVLSAAALFAIGSDFGASGAEGKKNLSLEQMLTYAIQDEYLARAEYEAIMQRYGRIRPFSSIIRAEERHIEWLVALFAKYGLRQPADSSASHVVVPKDLKSALEAGVQAEIDNIAMYEAFLGGAAASPLPPDVREVFERLKAASENHLRAFRSNLASYK